MGTILLYYKYVTLDNPVRVQRWQTKLCNDLGLKGRIIIAHEGINGTVGGLADNIEHYKQAMRKNPLFNDVDFKESAGAVDHFPRLRIVVRNEIVSIGLSQDKARPENTGIHLTPEQTHNFIAQQSPDVLIFDARNQCESAIGTFTNAVTPAIDHFRDLPAYIDNNLAQFKNKDVLMFCTGGIRCERATAYLKEKGVAKQVYQVEGGIHRYVEQYPDGYFRGKNYVFDGRVAVRVNNDILGSCALCATPYDDYTNCLNARCNNHFICCPACIEQLGNTCSTACQQAIAHGTTAARPPLKKSPHTTPSSPSTL